MVPKDADTDAARLCDFDSYSPRTKTQCPLCLGKLLQSSLPSLFLSFCLLGAVLSFDGRRV